MLLERMATWTRDKLAAFFQFFADKLEKMATWIGQRVTALFQYLTTQLQKMVAWIGQRVTALFHYLSTQWQKMTAWVTEFGAIFKDRATAFTVVKELTFGAVINAADVGTDIYTALSHYQLLGASEK